MAWLRIRTVCWQVKKSYDVLGRTPAMVHQSGLVRASPVESGLWLHRDTWQDCGKGLQKVGLGFCSVICLSDCFFNDKGQVSSFYDVFLVYFDNIYKTFPLSNCSRISPLILHGQVGSVCLCSVESRSSDLANFLNQNSILEICICKCKLL